MFHLRFPFILVFIASASFSFSQITGSPGAVETKDIDHASGNVVFHENIASLTGYALTINYNSEGVDKHALTWNEENHTGVLGLGWSMGLSRIIRKTNQTKTTLDDTYVLYSKGNSHNLVYVGKELNSSQEDSIRNYRVQSSVNEIVRFHVQNGQWEVIDENGVQYFFGDCTSNANCISDHVSNGVEYNATWGNWVGSSVVPPSDSLAISWYLSVKRMINGEEVLYKYIQEEEHIGNSSSTHTRATYLSEVIGTKLRRIKLIYGTKDSEEYVDIHSENTVAGAATYTPSGSDDHDAFQERYETRYLSKVEVYNSTGIKEKEVGFSFGFISENDAHLEKRVLTGIEHRNGGGMATAPKEEFEYYGMDSQDGVHAGLTFDASTPYNASTKALLGALKSKKLSSGAKHLYAYGKREIGGSNRTLQLDFPEEHHFIADAVSQDYWTVTPWEAPKLFFANDYVVAIYNSASKSNSFTRVQVYTWEGDKWVKEDIKFGDTYVLIGTFYDNYQPWDKYTKSQFGQIRDLVMSELMENVPLLGDAMHAFTTFIEDEVKMWYSIGKDIKNGDPIKAMKDFNKGMEETLKHFAKNLENGLEHIVENLKNNFGGTSLWEEYEKAEKEAYKKYKKLLETHSEERYHITLNEDFFTLVSSWGGGQTIIVERDKQRFGAWDSYSFSCPITTYHFDLESGDQFSAVHDNSTDVLTIYSRGEHEWNQSSYRMSLIKDNQLTQPISAGLLQNIDATHSNNIHAGADHLIQHAQATNLTNVFKQVHQNSRTSISAKNNFIVYAMTGPDGKFGKVALIYHDEGMQFKVSQPKMFGKTGTNGYTGLFGNAFTFIHGQDARIKVSAGNSFAALQAYDHLPAAPATIGDLPIVGGLINSLVADHNQVNSTFGIVWDENMEITSFQQLETEWGQSGIHTFVSGDAIHRVGRAHNLITSTERADGVNSSYRYDGTKFLRGEFSSPYNTSAFAPDLASAVSKSGSDKNPQFFEFNANTFIPSVHPTLQTVPQGASSFDFTNFLQSVITQNTSYKLEPVSGPPVWNKVNAVSGELIASAEYDEAVVQLVADVVNIIIQIATIVVPIANAALEGVEVLENLNTVLSRGGDIMMFAPAVAEEAIKEIVGTNHKSTSVSNNYISVNGKLFYRNTNGTYSECTGPALFTNVLNDELVADRNIITGSHAGYTIKRGFNGNKDNVIKLLKNGRVYRTIVESHVQPSGTVVHSDGATQTSSTGMYVSYGPINYDGYVVPRQPMTRWRKDHELVSANEIRRAAKIRYTDATVVKLHKITDASFVDGQLHDYVVERITVEDEFSPTTYTHYVYSNSSASYNSNSSAGIYGKVQVIPSDNPNLAFTNNQPITPFGLTEHYFYNSENFLGLDTAGGYPNTLTLLPGNTFKNHFVPTYHDRTGNSGIETNPQTTGHINCGSIANCSYPIKRSVIEFATGFTKDSSDYKSGPATNFLGRPYLTRVLDGNGDILSQQLTNYLVHTRELFFPLVDTTGSRNKWIRQYILKPKEKINQIDGVDHITHFDYDPFPVFLLRSQSNYSTRIDGEEEIIKTTYQYGHEQHPDLLKNNRLTEKASVRKDLIRGTRYSVNGSVLIPGETIPLSVHTSAFKKFKHNGDSLMMKRATYTSKTGVGISNPDSYTVNAELDVAQNELEKENYAAQQLSQYASIDPSHKLQLLSIAYNAYHNENLELIDAFQSLVDLENAAKNYANITEKVDAQSQQIRNQRQLLINSLNTKRQEIQVKRSHLSQAQGWYRDIIKEKKERENWSWLGGFLGYGIVAIIDGLDDKADKTLELIKNLRSEIQALESQIVTLEEDIRLKDNQLYILAGNAQNVANKLNDLRNTIHTSMNKMISLQGKASIAHRHTNIVIGAIPTLTNAHTEAVSKLQEVKSAHTLLQQEIPTLQYKVQQLISATSGSTYYLNHHLNALITQSTEFLNSTDELIAKHLHVKTHLINSNNTLDNLHTHAQNHAKSNWIINEHILKRDSVGTAIPILWNDARGTAHSALLDKDGRHTIVKASNADFTSGEAIYVGFEEYENYTLQPISGANVVNNAAHSGRKSLKIANSGNITIPITSIKPNVLHNLDDSLYLFSAWVRNSNSNRIIELGMNNASTKFDKSHNHPGEHDLTEWVYLESVIENPQSTGDRLPVIKITGHAQANDLTYIDDVLLRPLNSVVEINVYNERDLKSEHMNTNGVTTHFEYDSHDRLVLKYNSAGGSAKLTQHYFKELDQNSSTLAHNSDLSVQMDQVKKLKVHENVSHVSSLNLTASDLKSDHLCHFVINDYNKESYNPSQNYIEIIIGNALLRMRAYTPGDSMSFQFIHTQPGVPLPPITTQKGLPEEFVFVRLGNRYYLYGDGKLCFETQIDNHLHGNGDYLSIVHPNANVDYVLFGLNPKVSSTFLDDFGRPIQKQHYEFDGNGNVNGIVAKEILYNGWGKSAVHTKPVLYSGEHKFQYKPNLVTSYNWNTNVIQGELKTYYQSSAVQNELEGLNSLDGNYAHTRIKFDKNPLARPLDVVKAGNAFQTQNNQERTTYQGIEGGNLIGEISTAPAHAKDFVTKTTQKPQSIDVTEVKDRFGRLLAKKNGGRKTESVYDYNQNGYAVRTHKLPRFYEGSGGSTSNGETFSENFNTLNIGSLQGQHYWNVPNGSTILVANTNSSNANISDGKTLQDAGTNYSPTIVNKGSQHEPIPDFSSADSLQLEFSFRLANNSWGTTYLGTAHDANGNGAITTTERSFGVKISAYSSYCQISLLGLAGYAGSATGHIFWNSNTPKWVKLRILVDRHTQKAKVYYATESNSTFQPLVNAFNGNPALSVPVYFDIPWQVTRFNNADAIFLTPSPGFRLDNFSIHTNGGHQSASNNVGFQVINENHDLVGTHFEISSADEGKIKVINDNMGLPVFKLTEHNRKHLDQNNKANYHYFKYDALGKMIETGLFKSDTVVHPMLETFAAMDNWYAPSSKIKTRKRVIYNVNDSTSWNLNGRKASELFNQQIGGKEYTIQNEYVYNKVGQVTTVRKKLIAHDGIKVTYLDSIAYDYYADGKLLSYAVSEDKKVFYGYDKLGRLSTISNKNLETSAPQTVVYAKYSYNVDGKVAKIEKNNGTLVEHFKYDINDHLRRKFTINQTTGDTLFQERLEYFDGNTYRNGNITKATYTGNALDGHDQYLYTYDELYQLTKVNRKTKGSSSSVWGNPTEYNYSYDANGNIIQYSYDGDSTNETYQMMNDRNIQLGQQVTDDGLIKTIQTPSNQ